MTPAAITTRVYALRPDRPTPRARRGAVKVWSSHVERLMTSSLSASLTPGPVAHGVAELLVRLSDQKVTAELVRPTGRAATDAACLAAAQDPQAWPTPPRQIETSEFVVQFEFNPEASA